MSSPRGFVVGGMGEIGTEEELRELGDRVGDDGRGEGAVGDGGRGNRKARGLRGNFDRKGGLRTFRYMLKERRALFACGTYLLGWSRRQEYTLFREVTYRLAYAIFSEYMPLAKKRTRVVTETKRRPEAK